MNQALSLYKECLERYNDFPTYFNKKRLIRAHYQFRAQFLILQITNK